MNSSWLGLGMGGPDPATLADAPPFEGDLSKPSATAKPYPTTSTPESYALQQGQPAEAAAQVAVSQQAPVTYGSTPLPTQTPAAAESTAVASNPVTTQVGPYQQVPTTTAPPVTPSLTTTMASDSVEGYQSAATSRFSQVPPPVTPAAAAGYGQPSGRFSTIADQRVAETEPSAASGTAALGSRFSSPESPAAVAATLAPTAIEGSRYSTPDSGGRYSTAADSGIDSPTSDSFTPSVQPAVSAAPEKPSSPSEGSLPAPPTSRRPDPGYRPGGTSSYRKAQPIYADAPMSIPSTAAAGGSPTMSGEVSPASFEAELGAPRQPLP